MIFFKGKHFFILLIICLLSWNAGLIGFFNDAKASNVSSFSDVLSTSAPNIGSNHTIQFTTPSGVAAGKTITLTFDTGFVLTSLAATTDISMSINSTSSPVTLAATCSGSTWGVTVSGQVITLTSCTGTVTAGQYIYIKVGTNVTGGTHQMTNPSTVGAYGVTAGGTMTDSGKTWVAIVNTVAMTAQVGSSFTFTVSGVASGQASANGESSPATTSVTTTATSIPWGVLSPGSAKTARQDLSVTTNAQNGFTVTLQQNQPMTSGTGAIINNFANGASTTVPTAWVAPTGTMGNSATYGHYGITSDDSLLNSDEFGSALYAGNINAPRQVFSFTGPSDGSTQDKGLVHIGFKIQITSLQAAGNDYANTLTYIATPVF